MDTRRLAQRCRHAVLAMAVCAFPSACAPVVDQIVVGEGPRGSVHLERLASRGTTAKYGGPMSSFHATHPVSLSPDLLARAFTGLRIGPARTGASPPVPLFSEEDAAFLAPLIATALSQAAADQRVRFTTLSDGGGRVQGTLFVDRSLLRVTLSRYQPSNAAPAGALDTLALSSIHGAARQGDTLPQSWMLQEPGLPSIGLDYQILQGLADPQPAVRETAPPARTETDSLKELLMKQADEIEKLKKEVDALRRRPPPGETHPPKPSGKKKPAPAHPRR